MNKLFFLFIYSCFILFECEAKEKDKIWVEAEQFKNIGGWLIDPQFIDQMGSSYLLAHGLGEPVEPATTTIKFQQKGRYHVWVRTKDWSPFPFGPGKFQIQINQNTIKEIFGGNGVGEWHWQYGGTVDISNLNVNISLVDLTGFEGRIDAIYFSKKDEEPPNTLEELDAFRKDMLKISPEPINEGTFDLVVIGGGIAGICASIQAARLGLKVALVQNRPVLGGNNSSEIRLPMQGEIDKNLFPKIGQIVRELDTGYKGEAGSAKEYGDDLKLTKINAENNISLFLSTHIYDVKKEENKITAVIGRNIITGKEHQFTAKLFVDCTGDGTVGYVAGANSKMGREGYDETKEPKAPMFSDGMTLGTTIHWYAKPQDTVSFFPICDWAIQFSEEYYLEATRGAWNWETGFYWDTVEEAEKVRDHKFRVIYGHWSYLKNNFHQKYANWKLDWMGFIAGKRESRRLIGDVFLTELDILNNVQYPDAFITTTWGIDLHYPDPVNSKYYPGEEFIAVADHDRDFEPYHFPYRCLYSNNIENLFMAGRNISVSHIALGTVRVMKTTGMMGEVVGIAAYLCNKYNCSPREVYTNHLNEFLSLLKD